MAAINRSFFLLVLLLFGLNASSQESQHPLSGDFYDLDVPQFIHRLELSTPYKFYFDAAQFDSVRINISVKDQTLSKVLAKAFENTDIHFSIDFNNHVFITRRVQIVTSLPSGFYNDQKIENEPSNLAPNLVISNENGKQSKAVVENKLYEVGLKTNTIRQGNALVTGQVKNSKSGEPLANATIYIEKLQRGVATNEYGNYSLSIPTGNHIVTVQGIGMKDARFRIVVYSDGNLNVELNEQVNTLKEVVVSTLKVANIKRVQMGVERLSIAAIKQVPTVFGEADILKVALTLPGVKTVGEASTGLNVRGGSADQNLILLNDATIFNPSHFFGLFSAFNPEILKDVQLYKSSIPAKYGGRLSSVLDISSREGNSKKITGSAGIGLITTRFNIEGPIIKDKTTFILGVRTTYANWLLNLLPDSYKNSKASFNDVNLNISHHLNSKNDLYFTGYLSNDHFNLASDTTYSYSNRNISIKWKHNFTNKLNVIFTTGYNQYQYTVSSKKNKVNAYKMFFDINQQDFRADFNKYINNKHSLDFGISSIYYKLHPGSFLPVGSASLVTPDIIPSELGLESAAYFSDRYNVTSDLSIESGVRYSVYSYLGPKDVNFYARGLPKEPANLVQTRSYRKGSFINSYNNPDFRISARYALSSSFSIKAAYNSLQQYIHVLSNTTAIAPTDIWKLSDPNIKPQGGDQVSLGFYKNIKSNTIETSVEFYYKRLKNYLDYKPGASLVLNHTIETEVISTKGKAYGVEVMVKKATGKLNGWVSYTYSRILLKMDDPAIGAIVNHGNYYPANYDIPHDATMVGNFKVNHRFSLSLNVNYSTGRPITLPIGRYYYSGSQRVLYSDRNAYRIPDYFRTDFSMNIDGNYKVKQKTHNSWTIGLYNVTGRKNPYSVFFVSENGVVNGYKLSIFGSIIPFINFNIHF